MSPISIHQGTYSYTPPNSLPFISILQLPFLNLMVYEENVINSWTQKKDCCCLLSQPWLYVPHHSSTSMTISVWTLPFLHSYDCSLWHDRMYLTISSLPWLLSKPWLYVNYHSSPSMSTRPPWLYEPYHFSTTIAYHCLPISPIPWLLSSCMCLTISQHTWPLSRPACIYLTIPPL